jgi:hypothetical protein
MISKLKSWWFWLILSGLCLWIAWPSSKVVDYMANDPWQRQRWDYLILLMPLYYLFGPRKPSKLWLALILLFAACVIWFFWLSDSLKSKLFGG